jgi:hypothetical protein
MSKVLNYKPRAKRKSAIQEATEAVYGAAMCTPDAGERGRLLEALQVLSMPAFDAACHELAREGSLG